MPYLTLSDETSIYYEDFGDGAPIVFVAGGGATHQLWEQQSYALTDSFRVITYDHRGCGQSDKPRDGYTVDRLADDLKELIDRLSLTDATLVSHGFGGHIVLRFLTRHPDSAARAVLCAASPWFAGDLEGPGGFSEEFIAGLRGGMSESYLQACWDVGDRWMFHRDPGLPTKLALYAQALTWPGAVHKQLSRDMADIDHRSHLAQIEQPVLVAHGRHDRKTVYEGAEYLSAHIPNARLITFEDSAHAMFVEEADRFNESLSEFARGALD